MTHHLSCLHYTAVFSASFCSFLHTTVSLNNNVGLYKLECMNPHKIPVFGQISTKTLLCACVHDYLIFQAPYLLLLFVSLLLFAAERFFLGDCKNRSFSTFSLYFSRPQNVFI